MTQLAKAEKSQLAKCEEVIESGLDSFIEVGNALLQIREGRLYREAYGTFEDYCRERWEMVASRARQLISAAQVIANVETVTNGNTPSSERVARPLVKLDSTRQREAWDAAVKSSESGKPTAKEVEAEVEKIAPRVERINYKPSNALQYSAQAIASLSKIQPNDRDRDEAFEAVTKWIKKNQ